MLAVPPAQTGWKSVNLKLVKRDLPKLVGTDRADMLRSVLCSLWYVYLIVQSCQ